MSKCCICKRKINHLLLDVYTCRCKNLYCKIHLHEHNCKFDYNKLFREQMKNKMFKVIKKKVEHI